MTNDELPDATEEQIRAIAREEAQEIAGIEVEDSDGTTWSLRSLAETFELDRRTALKAMGLITVGYAAPTAALKAVGTAEAAPTDDFTVPGTLTAGTVDTGEQNITGSTDGQTLDLMIAQGSIDNYRRKHQATSGVSTSATSIITAEANERVGIVWVAGVDEGAFATHFLDRVGYSRNAAPDATTLFETNAPATRSYSRSSSTIELAMGSGSYQISAVGQFMAEP